MNTFEEARKYLENFATNHNEDYFEKMREYSSRSYGHFKNSSEIIQTSRDIVHTLDERFCDLEIGKHFVSPERLIKAVELFKKYLESKDAVFKATVHYYCKRKESIPLPVSEINAMRLETIEACYIFF